MIEEGDAVSAAIALFRKQFGTDPDVGATAPGRVNLIGEHTDYCSGFVFPMALTRNTVLVGKLNGTKDTANIVTASKLGDTSELASFSTDRKTLAKGEPFWANYVKGVLAQLDYDVPGFDAAVASTVPIGGGLSSSAALEVAVHTFADSLKFGESKNTPEKAVHCQKAEHTFADTPCGIMDQFISTFGEKGHALLLDCRSLEFTLVEIADPDVVVFIANSNVTHKLSDSEYPLRKASCEKALGIIQAAYPDVQSLRDATMEQLEACKKDLDEVTFKRARHVIGECQRCLDAKEAFEKKDYKKFGELMVASHLSLRDDYEVSCKQLDTLQEIAMTVDGVYGSRMTGGGFGGCTVTLAHSSCKDALVEAIKKGYPQASCFFTTPGQGAHKFALQAHL